VEKAQRQTLLDEVIKPYLIWKLDRRRSDWNNLAVELAKSKLALPFDIIIADETQDFSANQIRAIVNQLAPVHSLTFVLDSAQRIYPRGFTWQEAGVTIRPENIGHLKHNYRNTVEIAKLAVSLIEGLPLDDDGTLPDFKACSAHGRIPVVIRGKFGQQIDYAIKYLKKEVNLYRKGRLWLLRYYDSEFAPDGSVRRVQKTKKLAEIGMECPGKTAARQLAREFLESINLARKTPESVMTLIRFTEDRYLPFVEEHKRISTFHGYRNTWRRYLKPRGDIVLREFRTADGEGILESIAKEHKLTSTTLAHIKAFLSGIFRYAKRQGVINSENPMRDVVLPKGKPAGETYAYSLEEITQMLKVLPEPASTITAVAAFTGVRKGELRGFLWENYDGQQVLISQSFWRGHALEPKTRESRAPVPVIAQLARILDLHRCVSGNPGCGVMFASQAGKPINLDALARDVIVPLVTKAGVRWHGWHAFRCGLATNLHRLGVPDKVIQRILRHSNVAVTQSCYIKTADSDAMAAMQQFERSFEYAPKMHLSGAVRPRIM
jgi:integrase